MKTTRRWTAAFAFAFTFSFVLGLAGLSGVFALPAYGQEIENRSGADMTILVVRRTGYTAGDFADPTAGRLAIPLGDCSVVGGRGEDVVLDCSRPLVELLASRVLEINAPLVGPFLLQARRDAAGQYVSETQCELVEIESLVAATAFNSARGVGLYYGGQTRTVLRQELMEVGRGVRIDGAPVIRHRFLAAAFCLPESDLLFPDRTVGRYEFKPYLEYNLEGDRLLRLWEGRRGNYVLSLSGVTAFDRTSELIR